MCRTERPINHHWRHYLGRARSAVVNVFNGLLDPTACSYFAKLMAQGYDPHSHIDVLPEHRLIYVCIPKCASTTIKMTLSALAGFKPTSFEQLHKRKYSGLPAPHHVGISNFYRLATDPKTLRFSFVRNPYDRLVSAWADKFQDKPLVPGDSFIHQYLRHRREIDSSLPEGGDQTLSFDHFVTYAAATADRRVNAHWHLQAGMLDVPGIELDIVGRVESFRTDFARVLDHLNACDQLRQKAFMLLNASPHRSWPEYYTTALADRVYRAYERDFDLLGYPRAVSR